MRSLCHSNKVGPKVLVLFLIGARLPVWLQHLSNSVGWEEAAAPIILDWTWMFGSPLGSERLSGCPGECVLTQDRRLIRRASAVVFHIQDLNPLDLPAYRSPNQIYVFFLAEPPPKTSRWRFNFQVFNGFFNWTMTYRRDSDVPYPYATYVVEEEVAAEETLEHFNGKTGLVAWFVSNCQTDSRREVLVERLGRHLPVDVYGRCGNRSCSRAVTDSCEKLLDDKYKFYLALENSVCLDYVSEKSIQRMRQRIVPIVLRRSIAASLLPNHSFVAVDDFQSFSDMAAKIQFLARNFTEYYKYFRWKKFLKAIDCNFSKKCGFCRLCAKLKEEKREKAKSIRNIVNWWFGESQKVCQKSFGESVFSSSKTT